MAVQQERRPHMIATSGIAIFPLVRRGMFLANLYYRLNTILVDLWKSTCDDSPVNRAARRNGWSRDASGRRRTSRVSDARPHHGAQPLVGTHRGAPRGPSVAGGGAR